MRRRMYRTRGRRGTAGVRNRRQRPAQMVGGTRQGKGTTMKVKKTLMDMIVKWHQAGYALDEIAPLVPQVPKAEIAAIIHQYDKETRL
nr:MAG TPA: Protein of unknown function (DUF433) [Caudoviricetes sp.]